MYHAVCNATPIVPVQVEAYSGGVTNVVIHDEPDVQPRSLQQNFCEYCKAVFNGDSIKVAGNLPYHQHCYENMIRIYTEKANSKKENKTVQTPNNDNNPMNLFADAIAPLVQQKLKSTLDENAIKNIVNEAITEAGMAKKLEIKNLDTGDIATIDTPHKDLKTLLYLISKRQHVYLYGPAGSGKSTAAQHCAEALKIDFGYISLNPQTPDSRILGFVDAGGTYRETAFYKCYKNGGIFCIDEMDNASASLLTTLNSMLENGHGAFPNGLVTRHDNFVLVATGNTNGRGGNPMFPERRPFDAAFAERFTFLFWDYDGELEKSVALSINPKAGNWINYVRKLRDYCNKNYPRILVSPRASFKGAEYLKDDTLNVAEIAEAVIFKGLDKETVQRITNAVPLPQFKDKVAA
jgi:energy-coupling factor transporter ATP-binding protein EcfA2